MLDCIWAFRNHIVNVFEEFVSPGRKQKFSKFLKQRPPERKKRVRTIGMDSIFRPGGVLEVTIGYFWRSTQWWTLLYLTWISNHGPLKGVGNILWTGSNSRSQSLSSDDRRMVTFIKCPDSPMESGTKYGQSWQNPNLILGVPPSTSQNSLLDKNPGQD